MSDHETLRQLDELIQSRSILLHPFYIAWQRGELTRAQLATYATAYYPHVAAFPSYLEAAAAAHDPAVRAELEQNLADERCNPKSHAELWLDFAAGLGLDRAAVIAAAPHAAARATVDTFTRLTGGETAGAVAALYAYESQQPEVSRTKADGLREHYGMDDDHALAYFQVHAEADVQHREGERNALRRCLDSGATPEVILESARMALDAYWGLLDGICEAAGVPAVRGHGWRDSTSARSTTRCERG